MSGTEELEMERPPAACVPPFPEESGTAECALRGTDFSIDADGASAEAAEIPSSADPLPLPDRRRPSGVPRLLSLAAVELDALLPPEGSPQSSPASPPGVSVPDAVGPVVAATPTP